MFLDIVAAVLICWALVRGWLRGFLYQLGQIGMLALAFVAARALSDQVEPLVASLLDVTPMVQQVVGFAVVFSVVYVVGLMVLGAFTRDIHKASETLSNGDRSLGAMVGAVKGALLVYLCFVGLIMANRTTGKVPIPYGSSVTGRWVMQHNFFESEEFPRARALAKLGYLLHNRSARQLVENPHFAAIVQHPKAEVLRTPAVAEALARGDWMQLMGDEAIWDLLDEPEIQDHLNAIEWEEEAAQPEGEAEDS